MVADARFDGLASALGSRVRRNEPMARYTAMRVGGPVDLLIVCDRTDDVIRAAALAQEHQAPWVVLGGGCNVLVADTGLRGLVIINRASQVTFQEREGVGPTVRAESGALLAPLARQTADRGLAGLEWAAGLPGSVGGAVVGNAGAFEGDVASILLSAAVLDADGGVAERPAAWFEFDYRASRIKRWAPGARRAVVLAAEFALRPADPQALALRVNEILEWRQTRHPSGATMGSTFKNPPGSHAGYLIEQAGLRGRMVGGAQISERHGNFFMNTGTATAADVLALIEVARDEVRRQFGVELELEIELVGW